MSVSKVEVASSEETHFKRRTAASPSLRIKWGMKQKLGS